MGEIGAVRDGYHRFWWHTINDNTKRVPKGMEEVCGSILREGRFFLHHGRHSVLKLSWAFPSRPVLGGLRDWFSADAVIRFSDGEDPGITFHGSLSRLFSFWITFGLPRRWLTPWMLDDRVFGIKLGYIGDIAWLSFAHAEWADDTGMGDYYRKQVGRPGCQHSPLQLWPGYELKIKWPPVLRWVFGKAKTEEQVVHTVPVKVPLDHIEYDAVIKFSKWETRRARWPWAYRKSLSAWIDVEKPPQFAGKGENSWDCGDDAIYGMGSREMSVAGVIGDYVKSVLKNRERYGKPSKMRA